MNLQNLKDTARRVRRHIAKMHAVSNTSHIGSAFSSVDILVCLYFSILKINPGKPHKINSDRFVMSKGHAGSALYAVLAERGFFDKKLLKHYCSEGGILPGHVTRGCVAGVEVSTGSLGHGLAIGAGMALAAKKDKKRHHIFVLMSDGECQEGSVWETALFARQHCLENLIAIIDYNKIQAFGRIKEVLDLEPLEAKWEAFEWSVREIDGHDFLEINSTLKKVPFEKNKPSVIIAHTVKGKGVSFMEDTLEWHYKSPNREELKKIFSELE